jgi:hypothetical protein
MNSPPRERPSADWSEYIAGEICHRRCGGVSSAGFFREGFRTRAAENIQSGESLFRAGADADKFLESGRTAARFPALPFFHRYLVKWKLENIEWR